MSKKFNRQIKAFSLIELSIVILIISILLTGALGVSIQNTTNNKIKTTNQKMEVIYKAMGTYLSANNKLPCPAAITLDRTDANYGAAATTCTSSGTGYWVGSAASSVNVVYGMIPTQTLGLPTDFAEDGFGTKFAYMVIKGFTDSTKFGYGSSSVTSSTNYANNSATTRMIIRERPGTSLRTITSDAMFAIISYGANKSGGWNASSTSQNAASSDADETENDADNPAAASGVDNTLVISSNNSDLFDDIIFYKTRDQMTFDFDLLYLVACDNGTSTKVYGSTTFTWGSASSCDGTSSLNCRRYGEAAPNGTACSTASGYTKGPSYATKRCGAFGVWESGTIDNCLN